jgi:hypothetical protein
MVQLRLYSYGPTAVLGDRTIIPPDVFIAIEGLGTFEGVSLEKRMEKLNAEGKDIHKVAVKTHRESTRRGHASITTSLQLMMEVSGCSRALSMLLVAPPFGSYLTGIAETCDSHPRPHGCPASPEKQHKVLESCGEKC